MFVDLNDLLVHERLESHLNYKITSTFTPFQRFAGQLH